MGLEKNWKLVKKFRSIGKIEDKNGDVIVSASKARKIAGWEKLSNVTKKMNQ